MTKHVTPERGIDRVIIMAGGVLKLSRSLGISRTSVYIWIDRGFVPPLRAIQMEEMWGIPRADLMDPLLLHGSLEEAQRKTSRIAPNFV